MNNDETIHERIAILADRFGRGRNTASVALTSSSEDDSEDKKQRRGFS